jgi:Ser/Thr protein kinase RdoA (MazF antagonist)
MPDAKALPPGTATDTVAQAFSGLTPAEVLDALDAVGLRGDGRILQLNSYENRVFQVMLEDGGAVVAKFYRPGRWSDAQIAEEHRFALELAAAEVPVVAPLTLQTSDTQVRLVSAHEPTGGPTTLAIRQAASGTQRYAVAPRCAGRAPELEDDAVLVRLGGFIGRLHAVGAAADFHFRRRFDPPADTRAALAQLLDGGFVHADQAQTWRGVCEQAIKLIDEAFDRVQPRTLRLHGDCHPGNLLWRDAGAHVVDLDDCGSGPAMQDLWMLLSGEPVAAAHQLRQLMRGYGQFMAFDRRELQLIDALRLTRMIRHNAWVAQRWADPAFPAAFPGFGSSAYWSQQSMQLREQLASAQDAPMFNTDF